MLERPSLGASPGFARSQQLPPDWSLPPADIYAVYPERLNLTAKVTAFIEFLEGFLGEGPGAH
ncbi:MAG: LysR family transcriptional regulator, transcriptional activator for dmlA [Caballeronia sp.]|jgi:LysR family transcriptional activator of dmlA|nr:LysR family transcriptional regulator, transcriptional activator for dmlA [Caballeronia sp.]